MHRMVSTHTPLRIEDQLAGDRKHVAQAKGKPFKQVVNEALWTGLRATDSPQTRPCRLNPAAGARTAPASIWTGRSTPATR